MAVSSFYKPKPLWPELGPEFYDPVKPASFPEGIMRYRNQVHAERVGLGELTPEEWKKSFLEFQPLPQNLQEPLALRYHGHQFTHYNPDLGDGRGFLYGQLIDEPTKRILDLGTKGSGQTPWSRRGDGRLTLKGAMREALATGMLESLGVNTSKTFSIFETGEALERGDEPSPTRSAVLTRLSHSHVRIGTFQRLAFLKQKENMQKLVEFSLRNYYPSVAFDSSTAAVSLFLETCRSTALTTAQWMLSGFVHGVLNTDNINITGESFDYGPYRFLPHYDTSFVAAYFDHSGLYAYGRQPYVMMWNLEKFAEALRLLEPPLEQLEKGFQVFQETFTQETFRFFLQRLNLKQDDEAKTEHLFTSTIHFLEKSKVPFEPFFFDWYGGMNSEERAMKSERSSFYTGSEFDVFKKALVGFNALNEMTMTGAPISLTIDQIENIWAAIDTKDDWSLFYEKLKAFDFKKEFLTTTAH